MRSKFLLWAAFCASMSMSYASQAMTKFDKEVCDAYKNNADRNACYAEMNTTPDSQIPESTPVQKPQTKQKKPDYYTSVSVACPPMIEHMAKYDFKWTDGWFDFKFQPRPLRTRDPDVVSYYGDKLKLQNGFGAWMNVIYYCDVNTKTGMIVNVRVKQGRL